MGRTWANLGTQKEPKWSPKASQDGAKKEKKSEVKLREVSGRQKRVEGSGREVVTSPLGEYGETSREAPPRSSPEKGIKREKRRGRREKREETREKR